MQQDPATFTFAVSLRFVQLGEFIDWFGDDTRLENCVHFHSDHRAGWIDINK
jgi:hypothetical protein